MSKQNILFILYFLYCDLFRLKVFTVVPEQVWTALTLCILAYIFCKYKYTRKPKPLYSVKSKKPIIWIMICIFFSMIMAYFFHGQSITTSILAYREQYLMFGAFSLLLMAPSQNDIIYSLTKFGIVFTVVYIFKIINPSLFILPKYVDPSNTVGSLPGYELLCLLLFYHLQRFKDNPDIRSFVVFSWLLAVILLMQNRSTIGPVLLCCAWCLFKIKSKSRPILIICMALIAIFIAYNTWSVWQSLYIQTIQVGGVSDYNRNLAFNYFLFDANSNLLTAIFGNGLLSAHTSSIMAKLMDSGIYNTDVGFIGYYNQFGIIPVLIFIRLAIKGIKSKQLPLFMHFYAFYILIGGVTIMYFGQDVKIICFIVYYYLFVYYSSKQTITYVKKATSLTYST